uniref:Uncharacterized protein n=1 Tax=Cairina moschata TaxID=8855 RepID=A0A8C3C3G4_CAIMO
MKLLTHNLLTSHVRGLRPGTGFPLLIRASQVRVRSVPFSAAFVARLLPRLRWAELLQAAEMLPVAPQAPPISPSSLPVLPVTPVVLPVPLPVPPSAPQHPAVPSQSLPVPPSPSQCLPSSPQSLPVPQPSTLWHVRRGSLLGGDTGGYWGTLG